MKPKDKRHKRKKTTSCGALAWRVNNSRLQVLLIKQFQHQERWGIPKGHMNKNEDLEDCARRETREETGVEVELQKRLINVQSTYKDEDKTVVSWLARPIGDDTPAHDDPDSEVADARWWDVDGLPEILMYQRPLIEFAVAELKSWHIVAENT